MANVNDAVREIDARVTSFRKEVWRELEEVCEGSGEEEGDGGGGRRA